MRGKRPLNLGKQAGDTVRLVLFDPNGAWKEGAPQLELTLRGKIIRNKAGKEGKEGKRRFNTGKEGKEGGEEGKCSEGSIREKNFLPSLPSLPSL
jgi:hypothetical protein